MIAMQLRTGIFAMATCLSLTGCLDDLRGGKSSTSSGISGELIGAAMNQAPIIAGTPGTEIEAGAAYVFQPVVTDANNDPLRFTAQGLPSWASIDATSGTVSGVPTEADVGETAAITIAVTDGREFTKLAAYTVKVRGKPSKTNPPASPIAPTISGSPPAAVVANTAYSFTPTAVDPDSTSLSFSIANKPSWAAFNARQGALSGTPGVADVRTYTNVVITVTDGVNSASLPAFSITVVAAPNTAPSITGTPVTSVLAGAAYSFNPIGNDADGQALQYSIANKPSWATFNSGNGQLTGTPGAQNVGTFANVTISVTDGVLSASLAPFSITVSVPTNGAPSISGTPATTVAAGASYAFVPSATDPDGNSLAFSISGKPAWATFSTSTGALTGTPAATDVGTSAAIVISVSDGTSARSLPAFAISVTAAAGAGTAELSWTVPTENTDGTPLTDLAGYRIYHGTSEASLATVVDVPGASSTTYVFRGLPSGPRYFAIASYNGAGVESSRSSAASKIIN
jgi:Putative Ig domain